MNEQNKHAFRIAFDFMEANPAPMRSPEEYQKLAENLAHAFELYHDNMLACRLLSGVFDYICAESKAVAGK